MRQRLSWPRRPLKPSRPEGTGFRRRSANRFDGIFPYFYISLILRGCIGNRCWMRSPLHNEKYAFLLEELLELRKRKRWNQRELAAELGVGQDLVSRCESGKRRLDVFELALWCQACGTTLEKFVKRLDKRIRSNQLPGLLRPTDDDGQ